MNRGTSIPASWLGIFAGAIVVAVTLCGCGIPGSIRGIDITAQHSVAVLNQGIHEITMESANWRVVLQDMQAQLVEDVQSTLRHEIAALLQKGIGAAGSGVVCVTDAVPKRIVHSLEVLLAEQLGQDPPAVPPTICTASPDWIDLNIETVRQPIIHYYGYDIAEEFDDLMVAVRVETGQVITLESELLSMISDYELALNVSRIDPNLLPWATHLILKSHRGVLSEIPVVKELPKPKKTKDVQTGPISITWAPPHSGGDKDFDGHGPKVAVSVAFKIERQGAFVRVYMWAKETKSDWTRASGWSDWQKFYTPDPGWEVFRCNSELNFTDCMGYTDSDHEDDVYTHAALGTFRFVGDTDGKEAGTRTQVRIDFVYKLNLVVRQT